MLLGWSDMHAYVAVNMLLAWSDMHAYVAVDMLLGWSDMHAYIAVDIGCHFSVFGRHAIGIPELVYCTWKRQCDAVGRAFLAPPKVGVESRTDVGGRVGADVGARRVLMLEVVGGRYFRWGELMLEVGGLMM